MTSFDLFDKSVVEFEKKGEISSHTKSDTNIFDISSRLECKHENIIKEKYGDVCIDCGQEVKGSNYKTTRNTEQKYFIDPSRVQIRKNDERSIHKDVENMSFSDKIISIANEIYIKSTKGDIHRGRSRKGIIFACIFSAYKICGNPQSHESLINLFGISKKKSLEGLKYVNLNVPKGVLKNYYISPVNLIEEIMGKFSATSSQKKEVIQLYNKVKNKSSQLNRSKPKSVAAGLVYFWIQETNRDISLKTFREKVMLSELTIGKMSKEISTIIEKIKVTH